MTKKTLPSPTMIFQGEMSECGLACICMLLNTLGEKITLTELRKDYPISNNGASLSSLVNIMSDYGHKSYPVKYDVKNIENLPVPCILHYGGNHFVYIYSRLGKFFQVLNPATGCFIISHSELAALATGYAVILEPQFYNNLKISGHVKTEKSWIETLSFPGALKRCIGSVLLALFSFIIPVMFSAVVGNELLSENSDINLIFFSILFLFLIASFSQYIINRWSLYSSLSAAMRYSPYLFNKLLSKCISYFEKRTLGEIKQRFSSINETIIKRERTLNSKYTSFVISVFTLSIMLFIDIRLTLLSLVTMTIYGIASYIFSNRKKILLLRMEEISALLESFTLESIKGIYSIHAGNLKDKHVIRYNDVHQHSLTQFEKLSLLDLRQNTFFSLLGNIDTVIFLWIAFYSINHYDLAYSTVIAFYFFRKIALDTVTQFYMSCVELKIQKVSDDRIKDMLHYQEVCDTKSHSTFNSKINLSNINFGYEKDLMILKDVNLNFKKGNKIAIVGPSGSGKSTLLKVLAGLYHPSSGEFYIDNEKLPAKDAGALYENMYYLPTETTIFDGTIYENIVFFSGNDEIDESTCRIMLEKLGLLQIIDKMPLGLNTLISSNNSLFSSGQLQRLMICRALLSKKPIILLDEPTANLDAESAIITFEALLKSHKTILISTHNDRALTDFDQIIQFTTPGSMPKISSKV